MLDTFLRLAAAAGLRRHMWRHVEPFVSTLPHEESEDSLELAAVLTSPLFPWRQFSHPEQLIKLWAAAASALPYTDKAGRSVIDALLCVAYLETTRQYIPDEMWSWPTNVLHSLLYVLDAAGEACGMLSERSGGVMTQKFSNLVPADRMVRVGPSSGIRGGKHHHPGGPRGSLGRALPRRPSPTPR